LKAPYQLQAGIFTIAKHSRLPSSEFYEI
jgi:hypothetical protein